MSGEALKWALDQRGSDGGMQALLLILGLRADERGEMTRIDRAYLADKSRQSKETVSRNLAQLEEEGVLELEYSYDAHGGKVTTGRLRLDRQLSLMTVGERRAMQKTQGEKTEGSDEIETAEAGDDYLSSPRSRQIVGQVTTPSRLGDDSESSPSLYLRESLSNSLSNASADARAEREALQKFEERLADDFAKFKVAYPKGALHWGEARSVFAKLNLGDREKATKYAAVYSARLVARKRTQPIDPARWLSAREFDELASEAQAEAEAKGLKHPEIFIIEGTPWFDEWNEYERIKRGFSKPWRMLTFKGADGRTGVLRPTQRPPWRASTDPPPEDFG